jgi:DNA-binding transcriptional MerR regulator
MITFDGKPVQFLTTNDLCKALGIAKSTLFAHEQKAGIEPVRNNRNVRQFTESEIIPILNRFSVNQ